MALARRIAVAVAALLGLALAVFGAWFAFVLGPKGTAAFDATSNAPLVIGPNVLNRVNAPVTVSADAASGPVFLGAAVPQDVDELVGQVEAQLRRLCVVPGPHAHHRAARAPVTSRTRRGPTSGARAADGSITVTQDQAPQSVLVYPTKGGSVDVAVTVARNTWFLQSLVALVVGLIVVAFAGGWLWQHWRTVARAVEQSPPTGRHRRVRPLAAPGREAGASRRVA